MMVSEQFQSPNAIPPRTSSSGLSTSFLASPSPVRPQSPTKPVLKPVPEGDWIAQRRRLHTTSASLDLTSSESYRRSDGVAKHINGREWSQDKEKILLGPFDYMYDHPGKNIRKALITAFNAWLKVPEESLAIITNVVGMLHTASLLVDDVEDSSLLRRGIPVAHSIFGTAQTINSANYVYFQALQELVKLNNPKVVQIYTEELINLHRGQGMDLFWRDTLTCPNEDDYLEMVGNKTGGLFRLAVKLMQAESNSDRDYVPLVNLIGALFQIRDDYLNLASTEYTSNKGFCEDLTEGKFSFPIIHSIRTNPSNLQLINIIKQKPTDEEVKRYAVAYMKSTGSFDYCRKTMKDLHMQSLKMIDAIDEGKGTGDGLRAILDKMVVD